VFTLKLTFGFTGLLLRLVILLSNPLNNYVNFLDS